MGYKDDPIKRLKELQDQLNIIDFDGGIDKETVADVIEFLEGDLSAADFLEQ